MAGNMYHCCALVVATFAVKLGTSMIEGFGLNSALPPFVRRPQLNKRTGPTVHRRGFKALARLYSTVEATEQEKGRVSSPRRELSPSSKRRVKGAIRRRARRLARVRRKNKSKQEALARAAVAIVNDVAPGAVDDDGAPVANNTYFPPHGNRRARRRAVVVEQQTTTAEATTKAGEEEEDKEDEKLTMAAAAVSSETDEDALAESLQSGSSAKPPSSTTSPSSTSPTSASTVKRRRSKHSTIRGRQIVKGGKGRGLWRSVFGPRPLLEVHSIDELYRLVETEEWGLEDLSVLTWRGESVAFGEPPEGLAAVKSGGDVGATNGVGGVCVGDGDGGDGSGVGEGGGGEVENLLHPTVEALLGRAAAGTRPSGHGDGRRIGLAIEGGGMRGCVAAGMASCIHFLGLADSFDGVYGASAGSLVGAYFVSRQSNGTAVYHDILPSAGSKFIDMAKFPQALGFELPKVTAGASAPAAAAAATARKGTTEDDGARSEPDSGARFAKVIGLDYLLEDVVGRVHALDFGAFLANDKLQPLHVVASGVSSMSSVSLASRRGHFSTFSELTACIRASMLVPGLAGPLLSVPTGELADSAWGKRQQQQRTTATAVVSQEYEGNGGGRVKLSSRATSWAAGQWRRSQSLRSLGKGGGKRGGQDEGGAASAAGSAPEGIAAAAGAGAGAGAAAAAACATPELLVDAMVFEPLPYRSAIEDGCTDVVVLCTRPQGSQVLGKKPSIYETRVVKKYFNQHEDPAETADISSYVQKLQHLRTYAEDALVLEAGSRTGMPQAAPKGGPGGGHEAFLLAVAPEASSKEVSQLEMDRKTILQGCRSGFAACYDLFLGSATSAATAAAAVVAGDGIEAGPEGGSDIADIGPLARSGAEVALEYFPESLLSVPVDLNTTYYESGSIIPDYMSCSPSPLSTGEEGVDQDRFAARAGRGRGMKLDGGDGGAAHSRGPLRRLLSHARRRAFFLSRRRAPAVAGSAPMAAAGAVAAAAATRAGKLYGGVTPTVPAGEDINGMKDGQEEEEDENDEGKEEEKEEEQGTPPGKRGGNVEGRAGRS